jgi:integral membrane protein (TIGR01906 family)
MITNETTAGAAGSSKTLYTALAWLVTLLIPLVIVMTGVRLLLFPWFLTFEYNTPNFPADPYGFTKEERLHWANLSMEYLVIDAGVEFVGDLRFPDGSPVFNPRELSHFVDVKVVLTAALTVWRVALILVVLLALWAWRAGWMDTYRLGLARGGWLTAILIGSIILLVIVSFTTLFIAFHNVFFREGTWTFAFSDTFIRLFPERFWRDIFLYLGGFSAVAGALIGRFARPRS